MRRLVLPPLAAFGILAASAALAGGPGPMPHRPAPHVMPHKPPPVFGAPGHLRPPFAQHRRHARGFVGPGLYPAYDPYAAVRDEAGAVATQAPAPSGGAYYVTHVQGRLAQGDRGYVARPLVIEVAPVRGRKKIADMRAAPFSGSRVPK